MKKNIIHFVAKYLPATGGIQTHVLELSRAQANINSNDVCITTFDWGETIENNPHDSVDIEYVKTADLPLSREHIVNQCLNSIPTYAQLEKICENVDIIHIHDIPFELLPFIKAKARGSTKIVFTVHSSYFLNNRGSWLDYFFNQMLKSSDYILAPSNELKMEVESLCNRKGINIQFIGNGVSPEFFTELTPRSNRNYQIFCPRRLYPKNGVRYLARAVEMISESLDSFTLKVAGDGPERGDIEDILDETGQSNKVELLGEVPYEEMPQLYSEADVSVFPSLKEATSIAALESMASGTPVVATNVGGLPQIIDDHEQGRLVNKEDPQELANAIIDLLTTEKYPEIQTSARKRAEEYTWEKIAEDKMPY